MIRSVSRLHRLPPCPLLCTPHSSDLNDLYISGGVESERPAGVLSGLGVSAAAAIDSAAAVLQLLWQFVGIYVYVYTTAAIFASSCMPTQYAYKHVRTFMCMTRD